MGPEMTPLETAIAQAVARTPRERELPDAVLKAIEGAGFVVIPRADLRALINRASTAPNPTRESEALIDRVTKRWVAEIVNAIRAKDTGDLDPSAEG